MLKKILSASLVVLHILTQSASALELRPIIQPVAVQPFQISSDILKNENPLSVSDAFSFFNISDSFVNHALVKDQGMSFSSGVRADKKLSNSASWRLTNAYRANFQTLMGLDVVRGNPSSDSMGLTEIKNQFQLNPDYSSGFMPAASLNKDVAAVMRNQVGATIVSQYDYINDAVGRRTSVKNSGTGFTAAAFNLFGYNTRSELTGSNRYLGTNIAVLTSPVPAETRAFVYDPIGNRTNMTVGTTAGTFTANNLNQYISQTGPANTYTHDFDGNLAQITGTRNVVFTYDGENRLITVQPVTPVANNKKLDFVYDYQGRRVQKIISNRTGSAWVVQTTKRFVYDGWNMIEEQTVSATTKYYVYGLDLSQSLQGAGGVGGLLAKAEGAATHNYFYDGNGNISQLINAANGAIDARYEYDAYGNSILATGTQAAGNTMRFSTKYLDTEYSLYYYGYRYYDPATGRWLSRDPIGESGGWNLYGFVFNNPQMYYDDTGLSTGLLEAPTKTIPSPKNIPKNIPKIPFISKIPVVPVISAALLGFELYDAIYEISEEITNGPFREYVTYIFQDKCGITRYVGRTGGDMAPYRLYWRMQADILADRFLDRRVKWHHIEGLKDLTPYRDRATVGTAEAYAAIRGREQQLIDFFGGAISDDKTTPLLNRIRGVGKDNERGLIYHQTSNLRFHEELHPYTGN